MRIAPRPTGTITRAAASTETRHGKLACSWKIEGGSFHAEITVPPNTTAEVTLPGKGERITERGADVILSKGIRKREGNKLTLGSGIYQFSTPL